MEMKEVLKDLKEIRGDIDKGRVYSYGRNAYVRLSNLICKMEQEEIQRREKMSDKYYLLMYYVASYFQSVKGELYFDSKTTVENFQKDGGVNGRHCDLICQHSITQWSYELSTNQLCNGINLFLENNVPGYESKKG